MKLGALVECLGLPASGKTSVIAGVSPALEADGRRVMQLDRLDAGATALPGHLRRNPLPRSIYLYDMFRQANPDCVALIDRIGQKDLPAKALLLSVGARYQILTSNPGICDLALVDEGFLHRAIYLLARYDDQADQTLDALCDCLPVASAIIFLDITAEQCIERATARLTARVKGQQSPERIRRRIRHAHGDVDLISKRRNLMKQAITRMSSRGAHIINVDTSRPAAAGIDQVHAELAAIAPLPQHPV